MDRKTNRWFMLFTSILVSLVIVLAYGTIAGATDNSQAGTYTLTMKYEAEVATVDNNKSGGLGPNWKKNPGYTGAGFVVRASDISFRVTAETAGNYNLMLRYVSNWFDGSLQMSLWVNGTPTRVLDLPPTHINSGDEGNWADLSIDNVPLQAGDNIVRFQYVSADPNQPQRDRCPDIDYLIGPGQIKYDFSGPMTIGANLWTLDWQDDSNYFQENVDWKTVKTYSEDPNSSGPWNPQFIQQLKDAHITCLRFMDWSYTNFNHSTQWSQRIPRTANHYNVNQPEPENRIYLGSGEHGEEKYGQGVAYEWQIDLCNRINADLWINIPVYTVDPEHPEYLTYVAELAKLIQKQLNPGLKVYIEYGNETWNWAFDTFKYCEQKGPQTIPNVTSLYYTNPIEAFKVWASFQVFEQFESVYKDREECLVKVIAGQMGGGPWEDGSVHQSILAHLQLMNDPQINPKNIRVDAYALAPYYSTLRTEDNQLQNYINDMQAQQIILEKGLQAARKALECFQGISLVLYEGGTDYFAVSREHNPIGAQLDHAPGMYDLTTNGLNMYNRNVNGVFCQYTFLGDCWGLKVNTDDADSREVSPKYRALLDWQQVNHTVTLSATPESPQPTGVNTVHLRAAAAESSGLLYQFSVNSNLNDNTNNYQIIRDFSSSAECDWSPPSSIGSYTLKVVAHQADGTGEAIDTLVYRVTAPAIMTLRLNATRVSPQPANTSIRLSASSTGGQNVVYQYMVNWGVVRQFASDSTFNWMPTVPGNYRIIVTARSGDDALTEKTAELNYAVTPPITRATTVATPTFSPSSGTYTSDQTVTVSCATVGATIRYTINGTTPNSTSPTIENNGTMTVNKNMTIKAKAYLAGATSSAVRTAVYKMVAATPSFTLAGGTYNDTQTVTISCATPGATICYTTNGKDPTSTSQTIANGGTVTINTNTVLKAKAYWTGYTSSAIKSSTYKVVAATPSFTLPGGTYNDTQTVTISCATPGATICYTTNGKDPTSTSPTIADGGTITINTNMVLKAKAYRTGFTSSTIKSATYKMVAATPSFTPAGGSYNDPQEVTIHCATPGASIRYTTNGTDPTSTSQAIADGGTIPISKSTVLKARAYLSGYTSSVVKSATYKLVVLTPTFSVEGGSYNDPQTVTINCATPETTIRYTTNGTDPTSTSKTIANGGTIPISKNMVLKAKAYLTGYTSSAVKSATYKLVVLTPTFSVEGGSYPDAQTVAIGCVTPGATIRYTTDGTTPTAKSRSIANGGTIPVQKNLTLKAKAFLAGYTSSATKSGIYTFSVAAPTLSLESGSYIDFQKVTVSCATTIATLRYTTDGTNPTLSSPTVTNGGTLNIKKSMTLKVKAYVGGTATTSSAMTSVTYTLTVAMPTFSIDEGTYMYAQNVIVSCTTAGAIIRYTTNGTDPTTTSATIVNGGTVKITKNSTLKAKAWLNGLSSSAVKTAVYTFTEGGGSGVVYLGGYYMDGGVQKPCYWTGDGQRVDLDADGLGNTSVCDIRTYKEKVYCAGNYYDDYNYRNYPYYWDGTQRYSLNAAGIDVVVQCMTVTGDKVYAGGYYWTDWEHQVPCYWEASGDTNTRRPLYAGGATRGNVYSCTVYNGKVYYGGLYNDNQYPCYWDGVSRSNLHPLPMSSDEHPEYLRYGHVRYMQVSAEQVSCIGSGGDCVLYTLKDGNVTARKLEFDDTGSIWASPNKFCIDNGTIYTGGTYCGAKDGLQKYFPCYWVGSELHLLPIPDEGYYAGVMGIAIRNGVIYCGGYYNDGTKDVACYWIINGADVQRVDLPGNGSENAGVKAIYID